jgi:hypothetical protein
MSWSLNIPKTQHEGGVTTAEKFAEDAQAAFADCEQNADPDVKGGFEAAVAAAEAIIASGAVGPADAGLTVYVGGHANPDHLPVPGSGNDTGRAGLARVTVTVNQARVPA